MTRAATTGGGTVPGTEVTIAGPAYQIAYHQQDKDYYCGAACVQMVLHFLSGAPMTDQLLGQDSLYDLIADEAGSADRGLSWFSTPQGILNGLARIGRDYYETTYSLYAFGNADAASRWIAWSIASTRKPVITLVYGYMHWVIVRGFMSNRDPDITKIKDKDRINITGFDVLDPRAAGA